MWPILFKFSVWRRWFVNKRDNVEPTACGIVNIMEHGLVISDDNRLKLRIELEEVLSHKPG